MIQFNHLCIIVLLHSSNKNKQLVNAFLQVFMLYLFLMNWLPPDRNSPEINGKQTESINYS